MNALFFVGNKRSGTSMLVRLLNKHPKIFVSHESGALWLIWQHTTGQQLVPCATDKDPNSILATLHDYRSVIESDCSPWKKFKTIQLSLMEAGNRWLPAMKGKALAYLGDKIPNSQFDLIDFVRQNLPETVYIHMTRKPKDWIGSAKGFSKKLDYGNNSAERLATWVKYEQQVQFLKQKDRVITVSYEGLCQNPSQTMRFLCDQLGVGFDGFADLPKRFDVRTHEVYDFDYTPEALALMKEYGYE